MSRKYAIEIFCSNEDGGRSPGVTVAGLGNEGGRRC